MRIFSYLLVVLFVQSSCAHGVDSLVNHEGTPTVQAATINDAYYVPKITFDTEVSVESVAETIDLINQVVKGNAKAIVIEWNTPGGDVDSGFRLAKVIENTPVPVVCVVDGDAASMGMYILQSCDVRIMTKRSVLMAHEAAIGTELYGHEVTWRSIADRLHSLNIAIAEHIAGRMGMDPKALLLRMTGGAQWWINWEEALQVNAVDMVVVSVKEVTDSVRATLKLPPSGLVIAQPQ